MSKKVFCVTGMTCAACSAHVEKAVRELGISDVNVNLLSNKMTAQTDIPDEQIIAAVQKAGYDAYVEGEKTGDSGAKAKNGATVDYAKTLLIRFIASLVFLIPLMYFSMGHMAGLPLGALDPHKNPASFALIQLVLTTPVLIINGRFFVSGVKGAIHRAPNMDTLVSMGSGAAYIYGLVNLFLINSAVISGSKADELAMNLFFESAATILTLVTLGKFLEAKSKGKTRSEVDKLLSLRPQTATVLRDGEPVTVKIDEIAVGDSVVVLPGEYIPCDGVVISGATTLDKSAITGESMPEEVTEGGAVTSATLNITGRIVLRAQKVGKDSTLSQIIELIENAGGSKAPIQKIADRVSAVFVPIVCAIALVTLVVWLIVGTVGQALTMAISVLVISCPCALGLATPVAVMAGTGRAAAHGVLVKNAEVLQELSTLKIFALDKTATITEGKPRVTNIHSFCELTKEELINIAACLERTSTHPLATAIIEAAGDGKVAENSVYRVGLGVVGEVDGRVYALGNTALMSEFGAKAEGEYSVYLCTRGSLLGGINVEDEIKPTSVSAIERIKHDGGRVVMITGDGEAQARAIAKKAGIKEVYCSVLPDGKLEIVQKLRADGKVAMVGDGINDAPALKAADVGIAIGSGTDVAIEAADVVLVQPDLGGVSRAVKVSRATMRNVKQNLFWAFVYNACSIPLAAGVFYALGVTLNPMIAAAAMAFSSLFVVCNALRLTVMRFGDKQTAHGDKSETDETGEITVINMSKKGDGMKTFKVKGMMCNNCVKHVTKALSSVDGVTEVKVDLESGTAQVFGEFDQDRAIAAVVEEGYECSLA